MPTEVQPIFRLCWLNYARCQTLRARWNLGLRCGAPSHIKVMSTPLLLRLFRMSLRRSPSIRHTPISLIFSSPPGSRSVGYENLRGYTVRITGPGIDSRISIKDEEDVDIVEVMLKKVRRLIKAQQDMEAKN